MNPIFNLFSESLIWALGWTIVHSIWQLSLIALLLAIAMLFLNKFSSRTRYIIMMFALASCLCLPILTFINIYQSTSITVISEDIQENPNIASKEVGSLIVTGSPIDLKQRLIQFKVYFSNHMPIIVIIWMLGVLVLTLRFMGNWALSLRLKNYGVISVNQEWQDKLVKLKYKLGISKAVKLLESTIVNVPIVIGYFKPVILVPAGMLTSMTPSQVESILIHELAHIFRRDYLVNFIQSFLEIVFFYHPAVWWVSSQIRRERENCCDDIVLEISSDSVVYAKALTAIQDNQGSVTTAVALKNKNWQLLKRIRRLFENPKTSANYSEGLITGLLVCFCLLLITFSARASNEVLPLSEIAYSDSTAFVDSIIASNEELNLLLEIERTENLANQLELAKLENNLSNPNYSSMLFKAVNENKPMEVEVLLLEGANINSKTNEGMTPLMLAARNGNTSMVKYLIKKGSNTDEKNNNGSTASAIAGQQGYTEIARILDNSSDAEGINTQYIIQNDKRYDTQGPNPKPKVKSKLKNNTDKEVFHEFFYAVTSGNYKETKSYLEAGIDPDTRSKKGRVGLYLAAMDGHTDITKLLIEYGADVNATNNCGWTPLMKAAKENKKDVAKILIKNGADVNYANQKGWTALIVAVNHGNVDLTNLLIENGADMNARKDCGCTAFHVAVEKNKIEIVKLFLENEYDINDLDGEGYTPLIKAIQEGNTGVAKLLIGEGANIHASKPDGWNALFEAANQGEEEIAALLVRNGANVNATTVWYENKKSCGKVKKGTSYSGWSALMEAVEEDEEEIIELLIDNGADINAKSENNWTALFEAVSLNDNPKTITYLVSKGADVNARLTSGESVMDFARSKDNREHIKILEENGAR